MRSLSLSILRIMRSLPLSILIVLIFSVAHARDFLSSRFSLRADYEDLEGRKSGSWSDGTIRISSDGVFCAIDLVALGQTFPCQVEKTGRSSFGVAIKEVDLLKMYKNIISTVNPWPPSALERFKLLAERIRFRTVGNYPGYEPSHSQQLHDNKKADSIHVYMNGGGGWLIY